MKAMTKAERWAGLTVAQKECRLVELRVGLKDCWWVASSVECWDALNSETMVQLRVG